jgi:hypothetical protein
MELGARGMYVFVRQREQQRPLYFMCNAELGVGGGGGGDCGDEVSGEEGHSGKGRGRGREGTTTAHGMVSKL